MTSDAHSAPEVQLKQRWWIFFFCLMPMGVAHAEPPKVIHIEPAQKKFIPLNKNRAASSSSQNGVVVTKEKTSPAMRSDSEQLRTGFMRIDRSGLGVIASASPALPPKSPEAIASPIIMPVENESADLGKLERESDEIEGINETIDPVLALYGGSDQGALGSFRDVLSGRGASGLARHLVWPVPLSEKQYVSSGYGMRNDPFHGRPTFHGGIDIAAATGTPVVATADALVAQVVSDKNYGKYITLQHADGTLTRYGHLHEQLVREGQRVKAGQPIGQVGSTGRSTGAHLDYRVSKNGVKYDPLSILTVPASVAMKPASGRRFAAAPTTTIVRGNAVASNALPKRPMVIQVR
jgi:murein DD-endopeptidase MepM/ murein hydrolase activator NlpD